MQPGAAPAAVPLGRGEHAVALAQSASGELLAAVEGDGQRTEVRAFPAAGGAAATLLVSHKPTYGLAGLAGGVLRAGWNLEVFGAGGERLAEAGRKPLLGPGNGGPAAAAALYALGAAVAPDAPWSPATSPSAASTASRASPAPGK